MGSIVKSGTSPISSVLAPGEKLTQKGLTYAATRASDFICGTLQLVAAMNLHVFTTGRSHAVRIGCRAGNHSGYSR